MIDQRNDPKMALVSHRRFPVDRVQNELVATSAVPFTAEALFGPYSARNLKNNVSNAAYAGLLTIRSRNGEKNGDLSGLPNVFDEEEIGCGGYGVVW